MVRTEGGALLVDKPAEWTSADVVRRLKRPLGVKRIGHAGTLDPMATGLLVILFGKATKLQSLFLESTKEYEGEILLGLATDTDDVTGAELERDEALKFAFEEPLEVQAEKIKRDFTGDLLQRPPAYSAIKVEGRRSYDLARRGQAPTLAERPVKVEVLELEFIDRRTLRYRIRCSKGTYVRSLARDIGTSLGTFGCLKSIRRTASGFFSITDACPLADLLEKNDESLNEVIMPFTKLVEHLPQFELSDEDCRLLRRGVQRPLAELPDGVGELATMGAVRNQAGGVEGIIERADSASPWKLRFIVT